jgi:hypothetical protein
MIDFKSHSQTTPLNDSRAARDNPVYHVVHNHRQDLIKNE